MTEIEDIFSEQGSLAQYIDGYKPRIQQIEMAEKVSQAIADNRVLVAEAGTGTGKTFAYLAPAILSGKKVFISTATKNLQDQIFTKDIPKLRDALSIPFRAALLKGRSNYLCHHRLFNAESDPHNQHHLSTLSELQAWLSETQTGDLSETDIIDEQSSLWPKVTSTVDNCLGQKCPEYESCFIAEARRKVQEADLVIVNHHLLMSDLALKTTGQGEVLPDAEVYIIDEAHQLPNIATQFLGYRVSSHQLQELARDTVREMEREATDMAEIRDLTDKLETRINQFKMTLGETEQRVPWFGVKHNQGVLEALEKVIQAIETLETSLEHAAERGRGLEQCHQRCQQILEKLQIFASNETDPSLILWMEARGTSVMLHATPFDINKHFNQWLEGGRSSWIFTSATLTVAGKFNSFIQQIGLEDPETEIWTSPFDFSRQSLLYMPSIRGEPSAQDYNQQVAEIAKSVIEHSKGRIFLLFTSYKAMYEVAESLEESDYPVLVQGSRAKNNLLDEFRSHGNAVLLGTNSFWEGVDVRGEALSCVLIDKIPFASPGDPVLEARINNLKEQGGNPFRSIQIPAAVIQLKQGIGRLIRDEFDSGVLVLCDPRFITKPYGKVFMRSLPPMPITQNINEVEQFFETKLTQNQ